MIIVWLKFIICTGLILFAGKRVAKYGDVIAEKTGLSGLWIGVILVSVATSLPELFTGIGSTVFVDAPDLTVGNLFGANTYNLVNIAILDFVHKGPPLLSLISPGHMLTASLSLVPLTIAAAGIFLSQGAVPAAFAGVSIFSILIFITYLFCTREIFRFEQKQQRVLKELHKEEEILYKYGSVALKTAVIRYLLAAAVIAGSGIWLAYIGEDLAGILGWKENFIGSLFLGFATTLPEMTVSIVAIRLGARELAVANMLGSNFFNMAIIFFNDIFYTKASLLASVSTQHIFTAFIVILMTVVVISSQILKPKRKTGIGLSLYAIILIVIFVLGTYLNYFFGK